MGSGTDGLATGRFCLIVDVASFFIYRGRSVAHLVKGEAGLCKKGLYLYQVFEMDI